jgi:adhesin/invasin
MYGRFIKGGVATALLVGGAALIGVLPASAAAAAGITFSTIAPVTAGATIPNFTVTYTGGNGTTDNITLSGCGVTGTVTRAASGSVATFTGNAVDTAGSCTLTATDTSAGASGSGTSNAFTVSPSTAYQLGFTPEPPATAGAGIALTSFSVKTEDQYGNPITSGADTTDVVALASSCKLGGTSTVTEATGVATFTALTLNQTGTCYLTASDTTNSGIRPATSTGVVVTGGTPTHLAFTVAPPASVLATGTAVTSFAVSVEDANGYVDTASTGSTDVITISSPCLAASVPVTAVAGVATFTTVAFNTTGACVLTATDTSRTLTPATANVSVGQAQAALTVTTKTGYLDAPLALAATGGSGTGAVTFTVVNGTATGCAITSGTLKATKGGTCIVTATKAAVAPYTVGISAATTVTISSAPKAVRLVGAVKRAKTTTVTVTGYNFSGRPKVTSNVPGFTGLVTRDSGKSLTIRIIVKGTSARPGVKTLTLAFANGKHASVKYSLH